MHTHLHSSILVSCLFIYFMSCLSFMCSTLTFASQIVTIYITQVRKLSVGSPYILIATYLFALCILPSNSKILLLIIYYSVSIKMTVLLQGNLRTRPNYDIFMAYPNRMLHFIILNLFLS